MILRTCSQHRFHDTPTCLRWLKGLRKALVAKRGDEMAPRGVDDHAVDGIGSFVGEGGRGCRGHLRSDDLGRRRFTSVADGLRGGRVRDSGAGRGVGDGLRGGHHESGIGDWSDGPRVLWGAIDEVVLEG